MKLRKIQYKKNKKTTFQNKIINLYKIKKKYHWQFCKSFLNSNYLKILTRDITICQDTPRKISI